jgi:hypothetical protein
MDAVQHTYYSFIIRVWIEETVEEAGQAVWRGHITHVPSGNRRYVKDLDEITAFVAHYLEEMGIRLGSRTLVGRWLKFLSRHCNE